MCEVRQGITLSCFRIGRTEIIIVVGRNKRVGTGNRDCRNIVRFCVLAGDQRECFPIAAENHRRRIRGNQFLYYRLARVNIRLVVSVNKLHLLAANGRIKVVGKFDSHEFLVALRFIFTRKRLKNPYFNSSFLRFFSVVKKRVFKVVVSCACAKPRGQRNSHGACQHFFNCSVHILFP